MKPEWISLGLQVIVLAVTLLSIWAMLKNKVENLVIDVSELKEKAEIRDVHIAEVQTTVDKLTVTVDFLEKDAEANQKTRHDLRDTLHAVNLKVEKVMTQTDMILSTIKEKRA